MQELKKDHSIGAGTGAAAGAATGAVVGAAGGPIGSTIGAVLGAIAGAKAGDSVAEAVNPTEYDEHWRSEYRNATYYDADRTWDDYAPAYGLGYYGRNYYAGRRYDDVESDLERSWDKVRGESRLAWNDARDAVRDGWHYVERRIPGDADGDGR